MALGGDDDPLTEKPATAATKRKPADRDDEESDIGRLPVESKSQGGGGDAEEGPRRPRDNGGEPVPKRAREAGAPPPTTAPPGSSGAQVDVSEGKRFQLWGPSYSASQRLAFRLDATAVFSVTDARTADRITRVVASLDGAPFSLVCDGCACVGGNAFGFARRFRRVVAIEIDAAKVAMLRHNLDLVRRERRAAGLFFGDVAVREGDCCDALPRVLLEEEDEEAPATGRVVVFADPPWGGRDYKFGARGTSDGSSAAGLDLLRVRTAPSAASAASASSDVTRETSPLERRRDSLDALAGVCEGLGRVSHLVLKLPFTFFDEKTGRPPRRSVLDRFPDDYRVHRLSKKVALVVLDLDAARRRKVRGRPPPAASAPSSLTRRGAHDASPATAPPMALTTTEPPKKRLSSEATRSHSKRTKKKRRKTAKCTTP
mmetsp:Transcript_11261/g.45588  ORF Transcript_11261/g.45588 Transcript_11261/m.45588 type:complete len:430 (-) Transcript_11261:21-1310(-)